VIGKTICAADVWEWAGTASALPVVVRGPQPGLKLPIAGERRSKMLAISRNDPAIQNTHFARNYNRFLDILRGDLEHGSEAERTASGRAVLSVTIAFVLRGRRAADLAPPMPPEGFTLSLEGKETRHGRCSLQCKTKRTTA
jgi:hypothetical protein